MTYNFEPIIIKNKFALLTNERLIDQIIPAGAYKYDLRSGDETDFCTIEKNVTVNHSGTILTFTPFEFEDEKDYIELDEDSSPNFYVESFKSFSATDQSSIDIELTPDTAVMLFTEQSKNKETTTVFFTTKPIIEKYCKTPFDKIMKSYSNSLAKTILSATQFESENKTGFTIDAKEIFEPLWVTMKVEGRFIATVFARNAEAAIDQAVKQYQDADFGELEDIDSEAIIVEDEKGNFVWSK